MKRKGIHRILGLILLTVLTGCDSGSLVREMREPIEETMEADTELQEEKTGEISAEFKAMMDSYEAFFDEYIAFMKKYSETENPTEMLADYGTYLLQYADMMEKLEKAEGKAMNDAEAVYELEVTARIEAKLLEAAVFLE